MIGTWGAYQVGGRWLARKAETPFYDATAGWPVLYILSTHYVIQKENLPVLPLWR
jgi:hypothetical protein